MTIAIAPIEFLGSHSFASCKEQAEKLLCHLADGRKEYNDGANAIQGFGEGAASVAMRGENTGCGWKGWAGQPARIRQWQSVTTLWYEVPSNSL
jgi:hypothetical protein